MCNRSPECPLGALPNEPPNEPLNDDGRVQQNLEENDFPLGEENEWRLERDQRQREWEQLWENGGPYSQLLEKNIDHLVETYGLPWATKEFFKDKIKTWMLLWPEIGLEDFTSQLELMIE